MPMNPLSNTFQKDAVSSLDYTFDWTSWLGTNETISSATVTADTGLTAATPTTSGGKVTTFVSGGTSGTFYNVRCQITTSANRIDVRSINIEVITR